MRNIITDEQKREIEELAKEHFDALIAYGADLHREGIKKGAIMVAMFSVIGFTIEHCIRMKRIKKQLSNKKIES